MTVYMGGGVEEVFQGEVMLKLRMEDKGSAGQSRWGWRGHARQGRSLYKSPEMRGDERNGGSEGKETLETLERQAGVSQPWRKGWSHGRWLGNHLPPHFSPRA